MPAQRCSMRPQLCWQSGSPAFQPTLSPGCSAWPCRTTLSLQRGGASQHRRAILGIPGRTHRRRAQNPLRAGRFATRHRRTRDHQRRYAISGRFRRRRNQTARPRYPFIGRSGVRGRARFRGPTDQIYVRAGAPLARARASYICIPKARTLPLQRHEIVRTLDGVLADVRVCVQDWELTLAATAGHRRVARDAAAALRSTKSPRLSNFWNGSQRTEFHVPRRTGFCIYPYWRRA